MASKKNSSSAKSSTTGRGSARGGTSRKAAPKSGAVRNSAIPKSASTSRRGTTAQPAPRALEITWEMIARRAYEISQSPECRSEFDNWCRAERELRGA